MVRFGVTESASSVISFVTAQSLDGASYTSMFGVASDVAANFVSVQSATGLVTLTFGNTNTAFGGNFGSYVLVGTAVEGITQAINGYGATGTGNWGGSITMPTFS